MTSFIRIAEAAQQAGIFLRGGKVVSAAAICGSGGRFISTVFLRRVCLTDFDVAEKSFKGNEARDGVALPAVEKTAP
jgi:hypothetical protein